MKISHTNILATKLCLLDQNLKRTNFNINPEYFKKITKIDDNNYKIELTVNIKNTKNNPFPVEVEAVFETMFNFQEVENEQDIDTFLNVNAIQMVFPFMRAAINSLVSAALMPPLILPIIDVRQFITK